MSATASPWTLPADFYDGRRRAHRALAIALAGVLILAGLLAAGGVDLSAALGPHVERSEWAFRMTGARELNARGLTGEGVTVCVVDSGLDALHPDFAHTRILAWRDFVNFRADPYDDSGHGTAMTGIIVANGSLHGVAPGVQLIVAKVVNAAGAGSPENVAAGIRFCVDPWGDGRPGADIISISLGSEASLFVESRVEAAAENATAQGVFVVAAAGNDGQNDDGDVAIPAVAPLAIAVGAVDSDGLIAPFSSMGSSVNRTDPNLKPETVAPGVRLITTGLGARYLTTSGTSPAAAIVAGILALIVGARPALHPAGSAANILLFKQALLLGAREVPGQALPHDPWDGYGIIDGPAVLANV